MIGRQPGWRLALAIYLLGRVVTTIITLVVARTQVANLWTPAQPGYFDFVTMWDGDRYARIATDGYPVPFPVDAAGRPTQSEWAFYPAYPVLARMVMLVTRLPFEVVGPTLALVLGAVAAVLMYRLFRRHADRRAALWGVAVLTAFPAAPVLQYGYSESTCLLGLIGLLYFVDGGRYWRAVPFAVLLGCSRPIGLAAVPVVALVLLVRGWRAYRGQRAAPDPAGAAESGSGLPEPLRVRSLVAPLTLLVVTAVAGLIFPAVVATVAGRWDAYTEIQVAWRVSDRMEYFTPWLWMSRYVFGSAGPAVLALVAVLVVVVLASPPVRALGLTMWAWVVGYTAYLAAVVDPFSSLTRFLLLYFPLGLAFVASGSDGRWRHLRRAAVVALLLIGQLWWTAVLWRFTPPTDYPP